MLFMTYVTPCTHYIYVCIDDTANVARDTIFEVLDTIYEVLEIIFEFLDTM